MTFRLDGFSSEAVSAQIEAFKLTLPINEDIIDSFIECVSASIHGIDVSFDISFRFFETQLTKSGMSSSITYL